MRSLRLSMLVLLSGVAVSAQAVVVTPRLSPYAPGTDVSTEFLGLRLTLLQQPPGSSTYVPTMSPAIIETCSIYAACPIIGPRNVIGPNLHAMQEYRDCYNATRAGLSSIACGTTFSVMEGRLANPTDFFEFDFTWFSDPPMLIAYNAAGDEILVCGPFAVGSCTTQIRLSPSGDWIGSTRVSSTTKNIARVVVGSYSASAALYGLQYNYDKKRLVCP